jgi:hypothetical protein
MGRDVTSAIKQLSGLFLATGVIAGEGEADTSRSIHIKE